jgi:hypothetical protein
MSAVAFRFRVRKSEFCRSGGPFRTRFVSLTVMLLLAMPRVHASDNFTPVRSDYSDKYQTNDFEPSSEEIEQDKAYGGFPNNKMFNNDTKCTSVVKLFSVANLDQDNPQLRAFLSYARNKLMELDIIESKMNGYDPLVDQVSPMVWKSLPGYFPTYCRKYQDETLEDATEVVYKAARAANNAH